MPKKTTDINILNQKFQAINDWKELYQLEELSSKGNTEILSEMILSKFGDIDWAEAGLRTKNFKLSAHNGLLNLQSDITQFTEKRFCRGFYNEYKKCPHPLLGNVMDYEVPLTEPGQKKNKKTNQGDIDLISKRKNELLFLEVKCKSQESILRALLEIFVYTYRIRYYQRHTILKKEYDISILAKIVPCIFVFKHYCAGEQITNINKYPHFLKLLNKINKELNEIRISPVEFYIMEKPDKNYKHLLLAYGVPGNEKEKKITLNTYQMVVNQYFPDLYGNINNFVTAINNSQDEKHIEMLYRSFLSYYKDDAQKFIIEKINKILNFREKYEKLYPKGKENIKKRDSYIPYKQAYIKIAPDYIIKEFYELNLRLLDTNNVKELLPCISHFQDEETLIKLIESYHNIRIAKTKDWDGVTETQIDSIDEKLIIEALLKYDDEKIIPILERSLLQGKYNKEKVIEKLLIYRDKDHIYNEVIEYAETTNIFITGLTDYSKNAKKVIEILDEL